MYANLLRYFVQISTCIPVALQTAHKVEIRVHVYSSATIDLLLQNNGVETMQKFNARHHHDSSLTLQYTNIHVDVNTPALRATNVHVYIYTDWHLACGVGSSRKRSSREAPSSLLPSVHSPSEDQLAILRCFPTFTSGPYTYQNGHRLSTHTVKYLDNSYLPYLML